MNMDAASSSSTDAHVLPQLKYDVFLSFRGADTRVRFTSHLYAALERKNVHTYMDDRSLERGDEIGPALLRAIEQSKLSIIVFSEHYASSTWCLDELVNIMRCGEVYGQVGVPVFYDIDPSDVRWQHRSYADAFVGFEERFKENVGKVQTWRDALRKAANLSGFHSQSQNTRNESEFIETIVEVILSKLNRTSSTSMEGLVGMKNNIQQLESLLCIHEKNVSFRTVGIWGMGGCGKTTLADVVFHRNSSDFEACAFLANVREGSEKHGLYHLRNELLRKLLNDEHLIIDSPSIGSSFITDRLSRTKAIVVLDDVSDLSQLEFLLDQVKFGYGSRIIITTRNKRLLHKWVHEDHIYQLNLLSDHIALQLFQSIAFDDESSREDYLDLSVKVLGYTGCNPLALKVLASSFLHCKSKTVWEQELKKLERFPNNKVQNALRLCYDGLEDNEKGIFLDIACFLNGENRCDAEKLLEMHGFSPLSGLEVLIDMSLISIKDDQVQMHDLLQEMGKAIESGIEELGKRKRSWNAKDSYQVLDNESGSSVVEAIYLDMSKIRELQLSPTAFKNFKNLKLLKFYAPPEVHEECKRQRKSIVEVERPSWLTTLPIVKAFQSSLAKSRIWGSLRSMLDSYKVSNHDYEVFRKYCNLYFPRGLESLPEELRYLHWDGYPFKSLPLKYYPENLVEIHMPFSQVKQLWNKNQNLWSLKHLTLSNSEQLTEVPDLTGSPNIEKIDLSGCTGLVEVPSYFQNLRNLTYLNLDECKNIKILQGIPCNIEVLRMRRSEVEQMPSSIWSCQKLHTLDLFAWLYLYNLFFYIDDRKLLSDSFSAESSNLKRWSASSSSIVGRLISLRNIDLSYCRLSEIPDSLIFLSTLEDINLTGTMIKCIPTSVMNMSGLRKLTLSLCTKLRALPELPSLMRYLDATGCTSLMSVASSRDSILQQPREEYRGPRLYAGWERFSFTDCYELDESSRHNIIADAQLRILRIASTKQEKSVMVECPGSEIPRWFGCQSEGCEIDIEFPHYELDTTTTYCLGFALSVVVAAHPAFPGNVNHINFEHFFELVCECSFKTDNESERYKCKFGKLLYGNLKEDQVVMFLNKDFNDPIIRWSKLRGNVDEEVTEVTFRFYPIKVGTLCAEVEELGIEVKKCGFQWLLP